MAGTAGRGTTEREIAVEKPKTALSGDVPFQKRAVVEDGRTWTTIAGDESNGALMWLANDEL